LNFNAQQLRRYHARRARQRLQEAQPDTTNDDSGEEKR
jgi:hypothetical protein